jgi:hypothetical protein
VGGGLQDEHLGDPQPEDLHHPVRGRLLQPGLEGGVDGAKPAQGRHHQGAGEGPVPGRQRPQGRMGQALVDAGPAGQGCGQEVQGGGAGRQAGGVVGFD